MPRISRVVAVGYPHHVTQRGNYRQPVFDSETDYLHYLQWLNDYSRIYQEPNLIFSNDCYLTKDIKNWSAYLMEKDNEAVIDVIRQHTKTGRPCGNKSFMETIERLLERTLTALPRGRPSKEK